MGKNKYMKKIELMDQLKLTHHHQQQQQQQQQQFGVITRARALALQRAQAANDLELRSRRLQKPAPAMRPRLKRCANKKRRNTQPSSQAQQRNTRETTPCSSLIRNPDATMTPCSTTKRTTPADADRTRNSSTIMPTTQQMDDFFGDTENEDQRLFMKKYNFDVINDKPLPGRYEWEKLDP